MIFEIFAARGRLVALRDVDGRLDVAAHPEIGGDAVRAFVRRRTQASRNQIDAAARGYKDINLRALRLLGPGGILVTCSCSHHVSEAMLLEIVAEASLNAGRTLRVLERRTQAQDHPILLTVPETLYLKCIILQVA